MGSDQRPFYDFLEGCLRHKSEMVIFEAARAICNMKDVSSRCSPAAAPPRSAVIRLIEVSEDGLMLPGIPYTNQT